MVICALMGAILIPLLLSAPSNDLQGWFFPPAGHDLASHDWRSPKEVGLSDGLPAKLSEYAANHANRRKVPKPRWALWRHGRLVHVEGDFTQTTDVASLRKTWHAMIVGAAIHQGRIPSIHQPLAAWLGELEPRHRSAAWKHVLTQSAGFDYPYGEHPAYQPGQMWTYSDLNLVHLCNALARVFGRRDFHDQYELVARQAYFDAIGMEGWSTAIVFDRSSGMEDGVRFKLSLEHMGRLGLLALARGWWEDRQLVGEPFVRDLETKQTRGMKINYNGPNDGRVSISPAQFPEAPYGYLTWVNTDGDYFPGADSAWAWGMGAGGTAVLWHHGLGIVWACVGMDLRSSSQSIPHLIEQGVLGPDPMLSSRSPAPAAAKAVVGQWDRFETTLSNPQERADPYRDVELTATFTRPDGSHVQFWGFHDGGSTWKIRFMPDQMGIWRYRAAFSDGSASREGVFGCVRSDIPGTLTVHTANPIWFGFADGGAVLLRSLHVGDRFLAVNWADPQDRQGNSRRTAFLDWAQAQGYNMLSIASCFLNRNSPGRGQGWDTPALWPLDAAQFRRLEAVLDDLARRRIMVFPFGGFFGRDAGFPVDPVDQRLYIRYALARLGVYWNIVLNVGGPEPLLSKKPYLTLEEVNRLGNAIKAADVFGHPLTVHNATGDDACRDQPWLNFGTLQGPKTTDRAALSDGLLRNHHPAKPLYAQETLWSGNKFHPAYSDDDLRKNAYVVLMSAAVINFADNAGNSSTGFSGTLDLADRTQHRHDILKRVWDFFETAGVERLRPAQELIEVVKGGHAFCLADPGREYLVYLESPGSFNIRTVGGPFRAEWINAADTSDRRPGGVCTDGQGLTSPEGGDDWLVRLTLIDPASEAG